ncbi:MAG: ABC transporter permease [Alphaproteobacteria bacterium]|nr:ABC transporter permease [Alphaproteobacteria bacterium]
MKVVRPLLIAAGLLLAWEALVWIDETPHFILPAPSRVAVEFVDRGDTLLFHGLHTAAEIVLGLILGVALGAGIALLLTRFAGLRAWGLPIIVLSQAVPVFAIAPLLVLWLGYGMLSKVAMASLVIFFPVASSLYDGLRRVDPGWLDLARVMNAPPRAVLLRIRLPAALPAFATGARVAASVAPIGAVIGEWVGAGAGLGFLMTQQLGRGQTTLAFAALIVLCVLGVALYFAVDAVMTRLTRWLPRDGEARS